MKLLSKLFLIFAMTIIGMPLLALNNTIAVAQISSPISKINPTTLESVRFKAGSFKQNTQGDWDEFDANGNIRFTFEEILRDETTVYLREAANNVSIDINEAERVIYASWPGQARHVMHRITSATLAPPQAETPPVEAPIAPQPPIVTAPPLTIAPPIAVAPPQVINPISPAPVDVKPSNVTRAVFNSGEFVKSGETWTATSRNGKTVDLIQLGYDKRSVYLFDAKQNALLIMDIPAKLIRIGKGGKIKRHTKVTEYSTLSETPQEPSNPNYRKPLPEIERKLCLASGGIVEAAGMLGHERCTQTYSDANMTCTDSDQCKGRCLSGTSDSNQSSVIGTCQATDNPFGCFTEVRNGKTEFGLCVD